ncbi:Asp-tRNA(Asn)/Glu-tRNA(Gln) amidotransferase subunit GatC [Nakamurella sp. YIM 132087]|uniref:Aspartyl/glutamyl-tRNA(Asn/Gln) amidotransferase subunit C n=1 Tax=Nakamurella alba TaxID=2665158 RepID=A0A7K1FG48_9ACTN|nr:Asp-tRNA(Asn)/Glu-tRNA(Gln) amidotransferase subunit GatC [Nakamurella alba]MTD13081.1 Asp-tRNA(Asn)/Glu-tRNA(Gln) amidotransferase subunit GatC [Nakamurella alba]
MSTASGDDTATPTLTRDDVAHLARLARLELTDSELDLYGGQLSQILGWVAEVSEVATPDIEPTTHAVPLTNVFRADEHRPGLTNEAALAAAPAAEDGRFRVPQILGEE